MGNEWKYHKEVKYKAKVFSYHNKLFLVLAAKHVEEFLFA